MAYINNVSGLKPYEVQVLIDWFMYYMDQNTRRKLMSEFPQIYNTLCDRAIVHHCDGQYVPMRQAWCE